MSDSEYPVARFLRLKTGDDIVSEVVEIEEDNKEYYLLIQPQKVVYIPSGKSGYIQLAFMPWVFPKVCDHQEFTIDKNDVIIVSDASEKMNQYYWETVNEEPLSAEFEKESSQEQEQDENRIQDILEQLLDSKRTLH
jgi:hypothetical protein